MTEATQQLSDRIMQIAHERRRFGYRRIHDMLKPDFPGVNHKRVYRLYSAANLTVRKRRKAKRPVNERVPLQLARTVNEVWSMDFVSDSLSSGRRLKCLTVADDFSHECVDIAVDFGMSGEYVTRVLDAAARFRGYPRAVRTDNGPEFTSRAFMAWAQRHGIRHIRRVLERALVSDAAAGETSHCSLAVGLQRGFGPTAALAASHRLNSPSCIAGAPAMQHPPAISTNLATRTSSESVVRRKGAGHTRRSASATSAPPTSTCFVRQSSATRTEFTSTSSPPRRTLPWSRHR
jgi:hypothetical protein